MILNDRQLPDIQGKLAYGVLRLVTRDKTRPVMLLEFW